MCSPTRTLSKSFAVFGVFFLKQAISAVPDSILEAARLDGCGEWKILAKIYYPSAETQYLSPDTDDFCRLLEHGRRTADSASGHGKIPPVRFSGQRSARCDPKCFYRFLGNFTGANLLVLDLVESVAGRDRCCTGKQHLIRDFFLI